MLSGQGITESRSWKEAAPPPALSPAEPVLVPLGLPAPCHLWGLYLSSSQRLGSIWS